MIVIREEMGQQGCVSQTVCLVSITAHRKLWLVLQQGATRQALMCYVSRCNHLIIYCTDSVRAEAQSGTERGRTQTSKRRA